MKTVLALFLSVFIINSCDKAKSASGPEDDSALTLSQVSWITDTNRTTGLIFGEVRLFLQGRTTGTAVTVQTYGDGRTSDYPLDLDGTLSFSDTVPISFTHWATTGKFVESTVIKAYRDGLLIDTLKLTSDSIRYYSPSKYSELEDTIRAYRNIWETTNITTYDFQFRRVCFCTQSYTGPFHIFVKRYYINAVQIDSVDSAYNIGTREAVPESLLSGFTTLGHEFSHLLSWVWAEPDTMVITFNKQYGYPAYCHYNPSFQVADEELTYWIDSLNYTP